MTAAQIEDPAPGLRRLRDRRDLAALVAQPWAAAAARQVRTVAYTTAQASPRLKA